MSSWLAQLGTRLIPFADVAHAELSLPRLLRLSLFQLSAGLTLVLLNGTLNRVMIVELGMPAWPVALMVALPLLLAPLRPLIGFRSDQHRSKLGWRRVPFLWFGTLFQFGGLALMPFALLVVAGDHAPPVLAYGAVGLAFLLVGLGLHTTQTAGLALASDLAEPPLRPRVVALLYVMLLVGTVGAALLSSVLLTDYSDLRLIKLIQGAAVVTLLLNLIALWQQEPRTTERRSLPRKSFGTAWADFLAGGRSGRLLLALALGTAAFAMQDILLEPYGGQVLALSVSATTLLTALLACGALAAFVLAARRLAAGADPHRLAAEGALVGIVAFACILFSAAAASEWLFRFGTLSIGFGSGLFAVGMLIAAMQLADGSGSGLALGAWGGVQAAAAGLAIAAGGALRDGFGSVAATGALGPGFMNAAAGYGVVYVLEIFLLFVALAVLGPLVRPSGAPAAQIGLAEMPG